MEDLNLDWVDGLWKVDYFFEPWSQYSQGHFYMLTNNLSISGLDHQGSICFGFISEITEHSEMQISCDANVTWDATFAKGEQALVPLSDGTFGRGPQIYEAKVKFRYFRDAGATMVGKLSCGPIQITLERIERQLNH